MSDWQKLISASDQVRLHTPVTESGLRDLRDYVEHDLPRDYESFLQLSNGLEVYSSVILSAQEAILKNTQPPTDDWEELYMPTAGLFFFGEDADGDLFFFRRLKGSIDQSVYVWRHEDDSRIHISYSLEAFLEKYLSGNYNAWNL